MRIAGVWSFPGLDNLPQPFNTSEPEPPKFVAGATNVWDDGGEGNYWSDHTSRYPNASEVGNTGVGDTPYFINENNMDRYPLMSPFEIDSVAEELPEWAFPPSVHVISPQNTTYASENVTLEFTLNKQTSWMGYRLDGQEPVTVTGNTTLTGLSNGLHNVTVYAKDALENTRKSETTYFTVEGPEPFPIALVATASGASFAIIGAGMLVYFKKRKH